MRFWDGDLRVPASLTPWEIATHEAMLDIPHLQHVVRLRESGRRELINHAERRFRLYIDWCPHGDLKSLIHTFEDAGRPVPEPLIWCIAEALAECAVAMAEGRVSNKGGPLEDWREVVHRDIKPENIFLGFANPGRYPDYPKPLLGDFGLAFCTGTTDPHNPIWFIGGGTESYTAPETCSFMDNDTRKIIPGAPMNQHTNVWAIGQVLAALVLREVYPEQPIWLGKGGDDELLYPPYLSMDDDDEKAGPYSAQLKALINACLVYTPGERPSAQALRYQIGEHTREPLREGDRAAEPVQKAVGSADDEIRGPKRKRRKVDDGGEARKKAANLAKGMRSGRAFRQGDTAAARQLYGVQLPEDKYKLGMTRASVMPKRS